LWHKNFLFVPIGFEALPSGSPFFIIGFVGTFCYILAKADFFARILRFFSLNESCEKERKDMGIRDAFFRCYIRLSGYQPKVFTSAEKRELIPKMIEANRKQDRDVLTSEESFLKNLSIHSVALSYCGAWLLTKEGNPSSKIIYYIHGGGFTGACTKERMRFISTMVNGLGYNVFSIDYRLAPEFPFPKALEDCLEGYQWLLKQYGAKDIVFVGESAGGNLAITLSMLIRDKGLPLPQAIYANSAPTQFVEKTESYRRFSLKTDFVVTDTILENSEEVCFEKKDVKNPYLSPLYGHLDSLPPITLSVSECECLFDDSMMFYGALKNAGNEATFLAYPGLWHAFIMSPQKHRIVKESYPDFVAFLKKNLG
jgi:acetyl esterase/lipase